MEQQRRKGKIRYRFPGLWRASELQVLLNKRLGLGYQIEDPDPQLVDPEQLAAAQQLAESHRKRLKAWFYYLRGLGLIPPGERRAPVHKRCSGLMQMWTDQQVEEIIADLTSSLDQSGA